MENSLKQRIIGAIVLAALAIIFLPAVLKEKVNHGSFVSQIPEQPRALKEYVVDKKKIDDLVSDKNKIKNQLNQQLVDSQQAGLNANKRKSKAGSTQVIESPTSAKKETKNTLAPAFPAKATPAKMFKSSAWVVQVASFAKESNAINLVKKLKSHQFKAYRRKMMANDQQLYRVFVGPYIEKKDAASASEKIGRVSETVVAVRPFDPISS